MYLVSVVLTGKSAQNINIPVYSEYSVYTLLTYSNLKIRSLPRSWGPDDGRMESLDGRTVGWGRVGSENLTNLSN